jgi:hypothetical protein
MKKNSKYIKPEEIIKKEKTLLGKFIDSKWFLVIWFLIFVIGLLSIKLL